MKGVTLALLETSNQLKLKGEVDKNETTLKHGFRFLFDELV